MSELKYNVGDRVKVKSLDWFRNKGVNMFLTFMIKYYGEVVTIKSVHKEFYRIKEDGGEYCWTEDMIEGLVEEKSESGTALNPIEPKSNANCITQERVDELNIKIDKDLSSGNQNVWELPDGYIFKDENGNVINATKIVLEKVNTLKTQSDNMEHKELLLGLVPVANKGQELMPHKDYEIKQDGEKFYLVKKKKKYPKTYEECEKILGLEDSMIEGCLGYEYKLLNTFQKLLMCRDAYWKIAGEENGLGKPWKPDSEDYAYVIARKNNSIILYESSGENEILEFPTPEMRDAFYENFKEEIEQCKRLL